VGRWLTLIRERFPPAQYVPMAAVFVLGAGLFALAAHEATTRAWWRFGVALGLALSFFFRLRLFDEIKDYEVDLEVNPDRPLARGLIGIGEVKAVIAGLSVLELGVAAWLGHPVLVTHAVALLYTYLMYNEFYIGPWLRPHLTTYAVTHTVSSALLGWSLAAVVTGRGLAELAAPVLVMGGVHWALFNVFEFARKTFAPVEERPSVESYSKLFGPLGAALLTVSQVAAALALMGWVARGWGLTGPGGLWAQLGVALVAALPALTYAARPVPATAKVFRGAAGAYIVLFFVVLSWQTL
jgi:4-hydroxybenzoate polyprenyltransferase